MGKVSCQWHYYIIPAKLSTLPLTCDPERPQTYRCDFESFPLLPYFNRLTYKLFRINSLILTFCLDFKMLTFV